MMLSKDIYYKIFSYLYPEINYLMLINKQYMRYISTFLKNSRIKCIDDVVDFSNINFQKILSFLNKNLHHKFIRLNYIRDNIPLIFRDKTIYISHSDLYVDDVIQTHKLNIDNCNILTDTIKIKNTKHVTIKNIHNPNTLILTIELSNVEHFIFINELTIYYVAISVKIDESCNDISIFNKHRCPIQIIHNGTHTLKFNYKYIYSKKQ